MKTMTSKTMCFSLCSILAFVASGIAAEIGGDVPGTDSVHELPALVVTADGPWERRELEERPLVETLARLPLLAVNQQGAGAQSDMQIRGSSFSEAGLVIGPVALRNPQTEHFNATLPLSPLLFDKAGVMVGLDNQLSGASHLAGSVRLDLSPVRSGGLLRLAAAENGGFTASLYAEEPVGMVGDTAVGAGAFGEWSDLSRGLDYADNTLETETVGGRVQFLNPWSQTDIVVGHEKRSFGARGFYGVSSALAAFEETEDTMVLVASRLDSDALGSVDVAAYARQFSDEYSLPEIDYLNRHRSTVTAAALAGATPLLEAGHNLCVNWVAGGEHEVLDSASLGDHRRDSAMLTLAPELTAGEFTVTAGSSARWFSDDSAWFGPLAGISWRPIEVVDIYVEYVENTRLPSYTELNYQSPASLGNDGLGRETAREWNCGIRYRRPDGSLTLQAAAFRRLTSETIDWVKDTVDDPWQAENVGDVKTSGIELTGGWMPCPNFGLEMAYTWIHKDHASKAAAGRYILDYPEHQLGVAAEWYMTEWARLRLDTKLRRQTDSVLRDGGRTGVLIDAEFALLPPRLKGVEITVSCDNALDDDFQDIAGQRGIGRRFAIAVAKTW